MSSSLEGVEPALLWKHFQELCKIPRCSKNEAAAGQYVISVAESLGLEYHQDVAGNVLVIVPATAGRENDPVTILQGHLDMVCEKEDGYDHDFGKDPILIELEGKWLTAKSTSLGADNGVGVATGLAVMESPDISHGPVECLFTVDEETGLTGASQLSEDFLSGRRMLNLDSEEDGSIYIGCAGGVDMRMELEVESGGPAKGQVPLLVKVGGLRGGHSGIDIDGGRGNAIKILVHALDDLREKTGASAAMMKGGSKRNAIARDAQAVIWVDGKKRDEVEGILEAHLKEAEELFSPVEEGITITVRDAEGDAPGPWKESAEAIGLLMDLPHGVVAMSKDIENLVETSVNLATLDTAEGKLRIGASGRSSVGEELTRVIEKVKGHAEARGASFRTGGGYPGWKPNPDSPLLKVVERCWEEVAGKPPEVKAIHAGLECGIIGDKFPGMDMVAIGPQLEHPHSPEERVDVESVERFFRLVVAVLERKE